MKKLDPSDRATSRFFPACLLLATMTVVGMPTVSLSFNGYGGSGGYGYRESPPRERPLRPAIEINITGDEIVAFLPGATPRQVEMLPGETVKDVQAGGRLGAVVTSDRMLAISAEAAEWDSMTLNPGEAISGSLLSERLVLFVTEERGIVFDPELYSFEVFDAPVGERIIDQAVYADVAVLVTSDRTVGYGLASGSFRELSFSTGEFYRNLAISAGLISVITSDRVLLFQGPSAQWMEWTEYEGQPEEGMEGGY